MSETRTPRRHVVRLYDTWFDLVASGQKTAEVRKHDRDYQLGDTLVMVEEVAEPFFGQRERRLPRVVEATISHILPASVFPDALHDRYSVLSIVDVSQARELDEGETIYDLEAAR